jgi:hypothetical protein
VGIIYSSVLQNIQTASAAASVPTKWVPAILSSGVKRPGREAEDSPKRGLSTFALITRTGTSLIVLIKYHKQFLHHMRSCSMENSGVFN